MNFNPSGHLHSVGQFFIVGLSGPTLSDADKEILKKLRPAGILLLARNFLTGEGVTYPQWIAALKNLLSETVKYTEREKLIISLDHEGGRVHRTPAPITRFPFASEYASRCEQVAAAMAVELKSLGVNLSWAPVTDIHSNPANPIIGKRAFGTKPAEVIEYAGRFLRALEKNGIKGCLKHFPGHGDTSTDSHFELPVVDLSLQELYQRELLPFKELIQTGVQLVMTAHIAYPQVDKLPATLSELILKKILRDEFGFSGVIVSDDLDMKAVSKMFEEAKTFAQAFNAGCDSFIVARFPDGSSLKPIAAGKLILEALSKNLVKETVLAASYERNEKFIASLADNSAPVVLDKEMLEDHAGMFG